MKLAVLVLLSMSCADETRAVIISADGVPVLDVEIERAVTARERQTGLRGHAPLDAHESLLIELPAPTEVCIVNDGVAFAIDAVYLDDLDVVVAVARDIAAADPTPRCEKQIARVLELAAGAAHGVDPGDRLVLRQ